ncbi:DUF342 domain-containing protein [Salinibacillus xinjiangensis]|uniref:DUF342 domain-containing protein n=1 Tax=Salinibacillus xinjiangensis TaxID=1229268 RepID=A0A6G1X347_9BACI|nr:FapA family protein [Salinibacillus xinjiangensis]MRG85374.1 DUF342 domain-containing protein [Salinibacillus xinjiangensis]
MTKVHSLTDLFEMNITSDRMEVYLSRKTEQNTSSCTSNEIIRFLNQSNITYGIIEHNIDSLLASTNDINKPYLVARGLPSIDGKDGWLTFEVNLHPQLTVEEREGLDFRDVMKIPIVESGDTLVTIYPPTEGEEGIDVFGRNVAPYQGKSAKLKLGKNTAFLDDHTVISTTDGQVSLFEEEIMVLPTYEVRETIDMKVGNVDFNGSIVVHGDVPTGFSLKAKGDITITGLVEGATIQAGGSVFIGAGISAMHKGKFVAGLDVHVKYINQGIIETGRDLFVEESILHSDCMARDHIFCQKGNIIGGNVSAGISVYAKDVGNRLNTKTSVFLGENKKSVLKKYMLEEKLKTLSSSMQKLKLLGDKLHEVENKRGKLTSQEASMLRKQKNSIQRVITEYKEAQCEYQSFQEKVADLSLSQLTVNGIIYPNTEVVCGRYQRHILNQHQHVKVTYHNHEIVVSSLY